MLDGLRRLWEVENLSPHGIRLLWRSELIWTHIVSDTLIALAYFSIPVALATFVSRRRDVVFGWVFWSFAVFITACGATHLMAIWTLYVPDYGLEAMVKIVTAAASIGTALALWHLMPRALSLPSPTKPLGQDTGIGLSQVFGFTEQSGGSAAIVSGRARGTTVRLSFPAAPPRPAPVPDRTEVPGFGFAPGLAAG